MLDFIECYQSFGLLWSWVPNFLYFMLKINCFRINFFPNQTLLNILSGEKLFNFVLIELSAPFDCRTLYPLAKEKTHRFLNY